MTRPGVCEGVDAVRVYVVGPMDERSPRFNFGAFEEACDRLRADGYHVISPHETDPGAGTAAIAAGIEALKVSDLVVFLQGWEDDPGAAVDVLVAEAHGVPCVPIGDVINARIA